MNKPDFEHACHYALERLQRELPPDLSYHSVYHTRDDVLPALERVAAIERIGREAFLLLQTAAAYHDLGFIEQYIDHEYVGIRIAAETLPHFGFSPRQIKVVTGIILATKMPQSPRNLLEEIVADADLDIFGRDDFLSRNQDLRAELAVYGTPVSDTTWYREQLEFIAQHRYFTRAARALRTEKKQQNIEALAARLRASQVEQPSVSGPLTETDRPTGSGRRDDLALDT